MRRAEAQKARIRDALDSGTGKLCTQCGLVASRPLKEEDGHGDMSANVREVDLLAKALMDANFKLRPTAGMPLKAVEAVALAAGAIVEIESGGMKILIEHDPKQEVSE